MPFGKTDEQHSLFGEILDWMLAPLLLLWPMSIFLTYFIAQNIAQPGSVRKRTFSPPKPVMAALRSPSR